LLQAHPRHLQPLLRRAASLRQLAMAGSPAPAHDADADAGSGAIEAW